MGEGNRSSLRRSQAPQAVVPAPTPPMRPSCAHAPTVCFPSHACDQSAGFTRLPLELTVSTTRLPPLSTSCDLRFFVLFGFVFTVAGGKSMSSLTVLSRVPRALLGACRRSLSAVPLVPLSSTPSGGSASEGLPRTRHHAPTFAITHLGQYVSAYGAALLPGSRVTDARWQ